MNARHSKATPRWGTPGKYVEMARTALGGRIELDPMSEPEFNRTIGAERIYTEQDDCFSQSWRCSTMLLNPAGGLVRDAWTRLINDWQDGLIGRAVWIGFSVEQLSFLLDDRLHPFDFSFLLCRKRISFVRHDGVIGAPTHSNYVVGLGIDTDRFERAFAGCGRFNHGEHAKRPAKAVAA